MKKSTWALIGLIGLLAMTLSASGVSTAGPEPPSGKALKPMDPHAPAGRSAMTAPTPRTYISVFTYDDELNSDGDCSLREAIQSVNTGTAVDACMAPTGNDVIQLSMGTYTLSLTGAMEDLNQTGDLDLFTPGLTVTIEGMSPYETVIDGNLTDRIFHFSNCTVVLSNLTITHGAMDPSEATGGGGILATGAGASLTLDRCAIIDNSSVVDGGTAYDGGGLHVEGDLVMNQSLVSGNSAGRGGGIHVTNGGDIFITNSTISGNSAVMDAGGLWLAEQTGATFDFVTITANDAGGSAGGMDNSSLTGTVTVGNTIVAGNTAVATPDVYGAFSSADYNLIGDDTGSTGFTGLHDLVDLDALLLPLADNGGPTQTHALQFGSPALEAANPASTIMVDQRDFSRPLDGDDNGTALPDIGAFELPPPIVVDTFVDELNADGDCSLREAIQTVNSGTAVDACASPSGRDVILLSTGTYALTLPGAEENANQSGDLDISLAGMGHLTIRGTGAGSTILDGGGLDRVLHLFWGRLTLEDLTITNGQLPQSAMDGGGGLYAGGEVILTRCAVTGNSSVVGDILWQDGGGIYATEALVMDRCLVSENTGGNGGGMIAGSGAKVTILNSTFSGNTAIMQGGGLACMGETNLSFVTITNNTALQMDGGIYFDSMTMAATVGNTIIAGNHAPVYSDAQGDFDSADYNLVGDGTGSTGFTQPHDQVGPWGNPIDARLFPLADNGGPTKTHALMLDSPALEAADPASTVTVDQRGSVRPQDGDNSGGILPDIGAFELDPDVDGDGTVNALDNCPYVANPGQENSDSDGWGDACDNCPYDTNPGQENADLDGNGDACDLCPNDPSDDADGDGLCGNMDNCRDDWNPGQEDADGNGIGDLCQVEVNSAVDAVDNDPGDGDCDTGNLIGSDPECTLRAAIQEANALNKHRGIVLPDLGLYYNLTLEGDDDACASGDLDVLVDLDLVGQGADRTTIDAAGLMTEQDRVLHVLHGNVRLSGLTLTHGSTSGYGGAVLYADSAGTLTLDACNVQMCSAGNGGGLAIRGGTARITASTIANNNAWDGNGGGIFNEVALSLENSTITQNSISGMSPKGGGLYNTGAGTLSIISTTIAKNTVMPGASGAGIYNAGIITALINSIVGENDDGTNPDDLYNTGSVMAAYYSLVQSVNDTSIPGDAEYHNILSSDPLLMFLGDNGGPTPTMKLDAGMWSPAIDAGSCAAAGTYKDQRGVLRPQNVFMRANVDDGCDMGAYEDNDLDGDGINDDSDNCPDVNNPGQEDLDPFPNGIGDACESFSPAWTTAERLDLHRHGHTATLLADGRVLVTGGEGVGSLSSTEIYDPAANDWTATGSLNTSRTGHTAVLLPDGRVLVAGGYTIADPNIFLRSIEYYDPATGEWTQYGDVLSTARAHHTMTLLPDGRVLLTGGYNAGDGEVSGVDVLDPETHTASPGTAMTSARAWHTATLMPEGTVLVVGGYNGIDGYLYSVAEYDPAHDVWTPRSSLTESRAYHTATLLPGGKVLVTGGHGMNGMSMLETHTSSPIYYPQSNWWDEMFNMGTARKNHSATLLPNGKVLVAGGTDDMGNRLTSAEVWTPSASNWYATAGMGAPREKQTATLLPNGHVLIVGGSDGAALASVEVYSPFSGGSWIFTNAIPVPRYGHTATLLSGGDVLAAGGEGAGTEAYTDKCAIYRTASDQWEETDNLNTGRTGHTATLLPNGDVLVAGGFYFDTMDHYLATSELFGVADAQWSYTIGDLGTGRQHHTATLLPSGKVLVIGGHGAGMTELNSVELYDPGPKTWSTLVKTLNVARTYHTATLLLDGRVLIAGGHKYGGSPVDLASAEIYDPSTGLFTLTGSLSTPRSHHTATLLSDGSVLVTGGSSGSNSSLNSAEIYDPTAGTWRNAATMTDKRQNHAAVLLPDGKVMVTGGYDEQMASTTYHDHGELYDPLANRWTKPGLMQTARSDHSVTLLPSGFLLVAGGRYEDMGSPMPTGTTEIYLPNQYLSSRRPAIRNTSAPLEFGIVETVLGDKFKGDSEGGGGRANNSAVNHPLTQLLSVEGEQSRWLTRDALPHFWNDPMTLTFSNMPESLNPGWYYLTVFTAGVPSESRIVRLECSIAITTQPANTTKAVGQSATFNVKTQGARTFQWQKDGEDIPGATASTYETPTLEESDHGSVFRCVVANGCTQTTSEAAVLSILDSTDPLVGVVTPNGGESWAYSGAVDDRKSHLIVWTSSDNFALGRADITYTTDGSTWTYIASTNASHASQDTPKSVPDPGTASSVIAVPYGGTIQDVNVRLILYHPNDGDLSFKLIGPDSTEVLLCNRRGSDGDHFIETVFDDEAGTAIAAGSAPFTGDFRPEAPLTAFDGKTSYGNWSLEVTDNAGNSRSGVIQAWQVTFDVGGGSLDASATSYLWTMPTQAEAAALGQTFPSATCKVKVEVWDESGNTAADASNSNFYIIQPTTTSIKTVTLWHSGRIETVYGTPAKDSLALKLAELADHAKVTGVVLDLANATEPVSGESLSCFYDCWDTGSMDGSCDPLTCTGTVNQRANGLAGAIRAYAMDQIESTYTNTQFLQLVGDDGQIPFYRLTDGATIHAESQYPGEGGLDTGTTVGSALDAGYFLTDNYYGEYGPEPSGLNSPADNNFVYLTDFAVGRLVETPAQMEALINVFLAQDGQLTFTGAEKALVAGWDFMYDSALAMKGQFTSAGKMVDCLLDEDPAGEGSGGPCLDQAFTPADLSAQLFGSPLHKASTINVHGLHYAYQASDEVGGKTLLCTEPGYSTACWATGMEANGVPLTSTLLYTPACHAGLSVPATEPTRPLDLPELMARKGVPAYIANTGYGWGLDVGSGLSEALMEKITAELLNNDSIAVGRALAQAKRAYHLQERRWDVFDEKVVHELTLYGIPNYLLVSRSTRGGEENQRGEETLPPPDGPDEGCADGICLKKHFSDAEGFLPPGVTELNLHFTFCDDSLSNCTCPPQSAPNCTYQLVTVGPGKYYKLNNRASGEVGDTIQPHFVYNSYLSGTLAHGALFTGGGYECETAFTPVVAAPSASAYDPGGQSEAPAGSGFTPSVRASFGTSASLGLRGLGQVGYTNLTVHTGFFDAADAGTECRFADMQFVHYYSNKADLISPTIPDPGEGGFHTLTGLTATFTASVTDASGVYRVLVTYNEGRTSQWNSLDLTNTSGNTWSGSLALQGSITYYVQAVDTAGNVGILTETAPDLDPLGTPYGSTWEGPKMFSIDLPDTDADGLPDAYEDLHPACLDKNTGGQGVLDPDYDSLTTSQEFSLGLDPCDGDTDGGGENDGSELNANGTSPKRDPFAQGDDKHLTIQFEKSGSDWTITWDPLEGDNGKVDGAYFIYRSALPAFTAADRIVTAPDPLPDGTQSYTDTSNPSCNPCFYQVWNYAIDTLPPVVQAVAPPAGPAAGGTAVSVFGQNFRSGAQVTFDDIPATNIVFVSTYMITCTTPAHSAGGVTVKVINPNAQEGSLNNGFTYTP